MEELRPALRLGPALAFGLDLGEAPGRKRRAMLRALLALSCGAVRVERPERIASAPRGAIFVLSHHNAWEAILAPAALVALRRGRPIRFLVDWMFAELPFSSWLVSEIDPIPVYAKRARFGLREGYRRERRRFDPLSDAAATLAAGGDVGLYPEGSRQPDLSRLAPLRRGLARLALATGAPIVPVGVELPARERLGRLPRVGRIVVRAGEPLVAPPISTVASAAERREAESRLLAAVATQLAALSKKSPSEPPPSRKERTMKLRFASPRINVQLVESAADRAAALTVIDEVYRTEKHWIASSEAEIAVEPAQESQTFWLLARAAGEAVGVMRVVVDPELTIPAALEPRFEPGFDFETLARCGRFAEVGRMMVRPGFRRQPRIVLELMHAALAEAIERGITHFLTAVFEDDPHSPYGFHVRQLGFERIGTHERGELACGSRRILLALDLAQAYERLGRRRGVARELARGLESRLVRAREAGAILPSPANAVAAS